MTAKGVDFCGTMLVKQVIIHIIIMFIIFIFYFIISSFCYFII